MNHAIILAAGEGTRLKSKTDKMLIEVNGKPLIYYSLIAFNDNPEIESIVIVANKKNQNDIKDLLKPHHFRKVAKIVLGGTSRQESLAKGLSALSKTPKPKDLIVVHNGANPLPSHEEIQNALDKAQENGACIVGHFLNSTIKEVSPVHIIKTHDRKKLFAAETPQVIQYDLLKRALKNSAKNSLEEVTDEAMLLEAMDEKVAYIQADPNNFKVTVFADLERLKAILGESPQDFIVGLGSDSHMFKEGEKGLTLGGMFFDKLPKLEAKSDGDVILHALFNAISQALGEMSLGFYADDLCEKDVKDSQKYLQIILKKMKARKFKINSVGLMIECKTPQIDPLVSQLKKSLAEILEVLPAKIGITATSGENLTIFGAGMGIQCFAIVSLKA